MIDISQQITNYQEKKAKETIDKINKLLSTGGNFGQATLDPRGQVDMCVSIDCPQKVHKTIHSTMLKLQNNLAMWYDFAMYAPSLN